MGELPQLYKNEFVSSGKYAQASPLSFISKDDAPFLIYYSDDDPVIPAREATLIYQKLKENNVPVKIVLKPKEGHLPKPDMEEVDKWFKQYLKL